MDIDKNNLVRYSLLHQDFKDPEFNKKVNQIVLDADRQNISAK